LLLSQLNLLSEKLDDRFFCVLSRSEQLLWTSGEYSIALSAADGIDGEGDFILSFRAREMPLHLIAFSIAPVPCPCAKRGPALLITRVQGKRGEFEAIQRAIRAQHDIALPTLLVSAAEAIALALSLRSIFGISDREQLSASASEKTGCSFSYDAFWSTLGGGRTSRWYHFDVPLAHKPISEITPGHRRRAVARRGHREEIRNKVRAAFVAAFGGALT
jgi:uncharacterized protein VirK/YbjX